MPIISNAPAALKNKQQRTPGIVILRSGRHEKCMNGWQYEALLREREQAWDEAEAEAERVGNPHKNRHGVMIQKQRVDLVSVVLERHCKEFGLDYC